MINGQKYFDQPVKNDLRTDDKIPKTSIVQGDHYTTGCLIDSPYFKEHCRLITRHLSRQQAVDTDPKKNIAN